MVRLFKGIRVACEAQTGWLQVEFEVLCWDVGYRDSQIDVVLCGVRVR